MWSHISFFIIGGTLEKKKNLKLGDMDMCYQVDEYVEIDKLILATKIYEKLFMNWENRKQYQKCYKYQKCCLKFVEINIMWYNVYVS